MHTDRKRKHCNGLCYIPSPSKGSPMKAQKTTDGSPARAPQKEGPGRIDCDDRQRIDPEKGMSGVNPTEVK